jgi:hypothetical protein
MASWPTTAGSYVTCAVPAPKLTLAERTPGIVSNDFPMLMAQSPQSMPLIRSFSVVSVVWFFLVVIIIVWRWVALWG